MNSPLSSSVSIPELRGQTDRPPSLSVTKVTTGLVEGLSVLWSTKHGLACLGMSVGKAHWQERTSESTTMPALFLGTRLSSSPPC